MLSGWFPIITRRYDQSKRSKKQSNDQYISVVWNHYLWWTSSLAAISCISTTSYVWFMCALRRNTGNLWNRYVCNYFDRQSLIIVRFGIENCSNELCHWAHFVQSVDINDFINANCKKNGRKHVWCNTGSRVELFNYFSIFGMGFTKLQIQSITSVGVCLI